MDAVTMGDRAACDKHDISLRTLQRYRSRLDDDPRLAQVVAEKKRLQDEAWADEIPSAIASCVQFLREASQQCDRKDPDAVHAISGAMKLLSEVSLTRKVIDARLSGADSEDREED